MKHPLFDKTFDLRPNRPTNEGSGRRPLIPILTAILILFQVTSTLGGPVSLTTSGSPYTQNFNTLFNGNGSVRNTPQNQELSEAAWNSAGTGSTSGGTSESGWWQSSNIPWLRAADGSSAAGGDNNDPTSWGANGSTERALGLGSSNSETATLGVQFQNLVGSPIVALDISFIGEQWRVGGTYNRTSPDRLAFEYSVNATSLTDGTWTALPALDFYSPVYTIYPTQYAPINGNAVTNRQALSASITGLNIPNGATFFLRWSSVNNPNGNDGLGIDDFSMTPIANAGVLDHYEVAASPSSSIGAPFTVTVTAKDVLNMTVTTNAPIPVTLSSSGSVLFDGNTNGVFGEAADDTLILTGGTLTISARDDFLESVSLTATDTNGITGSSAPINITDISAGLYYAQPPADTDAGSILSPSVTVVVTNASGTFINGVAITVSLVNGSGTLSGTLTRTTSGGVATFDDLQVDEAGLKTLRAAAGALFADAVFTLNEVPEKHNRIGILWSSWDPSHFQNYSVYIDSLVDWGINYVSLNPTYFMDTYAEGIVTIWQGTPKTPDATLQKNVLKELISRGFYINYRPHIDPIKYAMPLGSTRDNWNTNPGGKDWRGKFDQLDPTDPTIGYMETVILPSLQILADAIREAGTPVRPIRYDLGAELMDSTLNYTTNWQNVLTTVRSALTNQHSDVAANIVLSHNFCHHFEYLLRLPDHSNYMARVSADLTLDPESQYLDRPGVSTATKIAIGQYIAGLDEMSISQYMPLDIFNTGGDPTNTTPTQVKDALQLYEDDFIYEVLLGELQIAPEDVPVLHIGEYGMGIRGLTAPNVWDEADWIANGNGHLLLSDEVQKVHAGIAVQGIIQYVNSPANRNHSFLLWIGGKPYDVLGLNTYSEGWFNPVAANALETYWDEYTEIPPEAGTPILIAPYITGITGLADGMIQISGSGQNGANLQVLSSTDLSQPTSMWTPIHTGIFTNGIYQFTDPAATNHSQRFYIFVSP